MAILNRIRGNPEALSTFVVVILAVSIALIIALFKFEFNPMMVVGAFIAALLGAAASALLTLFIRFLAEPDLGEIPRTFLKAVRQEIRDTGYYCRDLSFTLELNEGENKLTFSYSSTIVPIVERALMKRPKGNPPDGLEFKNPKEPIVYKHDKKKVESDDNIEIIKDTEEWCEIDYSIENNWEHPIKDEHRWRCPAEGFKLTVKIPKEGYKFKALTLRGSDEEVVKERDSHTEGERIFVQHKTLFSHQGFQWSIEKSS